MDFHAVMKTLTLVIGGLGLFLYGLKQMSEGIQNVAGEGLRKMISLVTDNRLVACLVGIGVTGLIQSSSITTVMLVGLVNAGVMTLSQAVGVIFGTNIGTTVTAWLVALDVLEYGLPLIGVSVFFYLFAKSERMQYTALFVFGVGLIFYGLLLMKTGIAPLKESPYIAQIMAAFRPDHLGGLIQCILAGAFVTAIIQSSSATVAITITLASAGMITFETAVALVLGENIGTTITAFLASIGMTTTARRTAYAHIFFNIIGVMILIPFFQHYLLVINAIITPTHPVATRIALSHTFFNVFVASLLLPFLHPYTRFVALIVPDRKKRREKSHLTYLDVRFLDSPAFAIHQSYREILLMGESVLQMMDHLRTVMEEENQKKLIEDKIFFKEREFDVIQKEIVEFIGKMLAGTLSHEITTEARIQLRMADEYESISDYIVSTLKLRCRMRNNQMTFHPKGKKEILGLHDTVRHFLACLYQTLPTRDKDALLEIKEMGEQITHRVKDIRANHLELLERNETSSLLSLIYLDMLNCYRRVKDHGINIAEALGGEK